MEVMTWHFHSAQWSRWFDSIHAAACCGVVTEAGSVMPVSAVNFARHVGQKQVLGMDAYVRSGWTISQNTKKRMKSRLTPSGCNVATVLLTASTFRFRHSSRVGQTNSTQSSFARSPVPVTA
jgi:hypothetical protein